MVISKRGCDCFPQRPHGRLANLIDLSWSCPDQHHEMPHSITVTTSCQQFSELFCIFSPYLLCGGVIVIRRFIHCQFLDLANELDCRFHSQRRTGGDTIQGCRPTHLFDDGFDVFDFTLERIRLSIGAVTSAPAIKVNYSEMRRQQVGELRHSLVERSILQRPLDKDHHRSLTGLIERDPCTIF